MKQEMPLAGFVGEAEEVRVGFEVMTMCFTDGEETQAL